MLRTKEVVIKRGKLEFLLEAIRMDDGKVFVVNRQGGKITVFNTTSEELKQIEKEFSERKQ